MVLSKYIGPVNQESTPSIIAGKLREAISHGEVPPGSQMVEAELARELGVSRGPLREAMQRLTQEGLLVSIRHRGLFVIELTEADVRDIYVARTAAERAAATEIFGHDPASAGSRLLSITQTMAQASERGDGAAIGEADIQFHKALVEMAQSPRLSRIHHTLLTETVMCITALQETYPAPDDRVREHQEIAEAVIAADAELVDRLLIAHMADAVARLGRGIPPQPSQDMTAAR
jgi:DNA-binding GntR family transcriptional regulator